MEDAVVETMPSGIWTHHGPAPVMDRAHRHDDVELNLVLRGHLDYLFGGAPVRVRAGEIALFWAATPHHLIPSPTRSLGAWVHLPLGTALAWTLPAPDLATLLSPRPVIVDAAVVCPDPAAVFTSWQAELLEEDPTIALLEVQALVRRLLRAGRDGPEHPDGGPHPGQAHSAVEMARFIGAHFREPITPADVAGAVHLNPTYAMTLFRRSVGTTIGTYLSRCRVAEAQRLLIGTSMTTAEVAHASGFSSQSAFYEQFSRICGLPPGRYRQVRRSGSPA
ncbi:helix-turn-helix domain-containing protein [Occultella glacieicola]|uniref:Helix-turn-helix domain-containing protein n=1 Tax=Occultella glacieicola TaxID=2518684 RepID=A0ABY2E375_9MICO|nr:helix-turn-helix domain-containing protein [Occultella glacieicola]TDE92644.1 helix-turn-helix domain-containing protein [Occultella glacieicola]